MLEVGAGNGSTTSVLQSTKVKSWVCLEPDKQLAEQLHGFALSRPYCQQIEVIHGILSDLNRQFDTILYIDVLEHIQNDQQELKMAADSLNDGGCLIVLAPAYMKLYSPFDHAIGHYRRYNQNTLRSVAPPQLAEEALFFLDCPGLLLSLVNRAFLRAAAPSAHSIMIWDRIFIPIAQILDPIVNYRVGRSIIAVWRKNSGSQSNPH